MEQEIQFVSDIRKFNRFYTRQLGLLQQHVFDSEYSLTEVRALYEIMFNGQTTATGIREALQIDAGYLSRILRNFEKKGLLIKHPLPEDGRASYLQLTARGKKLMSSMNELSNHQIREMLTSLEPAQKQKVADSMNVLRYLLHAPGSDHTIGQVHIRTDLRPGDIGEMIRLHGQLYAREYQYGIAFEQYVLETFQECMQSYQPEKDRIWQAYCNGELAGMIAILSRGRGRAQLRWFLVRPDLRGLGLGKVLINQAMAFCRQRKFREVYLLTTHQQDKAARLYMKAGFVKTGSTAQHLWGHDLYEEKYELKLHYR